MPEQLLTNLEKESILDLHLGDQVEKKVACLSAMTYNEYFQVLDSGISENDLITFKYDDYNSSILKDGLYVKGKV